MAKYDKQNFENAFTAIDECEQGTLGKSQAISKLMQAGIAEGSANLLIESYKRLRKGAVYKRAFSEEATRVFLSKIHIKHGPSALALSLQAVALHLAYRAGRREFLPGLQDVMDHFRQYVEKAPVPLPDEEIDEPPCVEGRRIQVWVSRVERSPQARNKCIEHHGTKCAVCDFSFGEFYGEIGEGFIHVHHLDPVSHTEGEYQIDPIKDLCPLCPNCHAMAHRENPPIKIDKLRRIIKLQRNATVGTV